MKDFQLDDRLANDSIPLGELDLCLLLLMKNALVPWFILVPKVAEQELFQLSQDQQLTLLDEVNLISRFIGNIVQQLHVHIVGRKKDDFCWPGVVWGAKQRQDYAPAQIDRLKTLLFQQLQDRIQEV